MCSYIEFCSIFNVLHVFGRCGECKNVAGIWEELAIKFNKADGGAVVAKVDCQVESDLCAYQDISDYPT